MTFKEKLDEKLREDLTEALWEEIQDLFRNAGSSKLRKGVTIQIFPSSSSDNIYYIMDGEFTGREFKQAYSEKILKRVIPICKKEGIDVDDTKGRNTIYLTYTPDLT